MNIGKKGEELAKKYILTKGYEILENNINFSNYEVDLVAAKDNNIFFIEVKSSSSQFFAPEDYINSKKLKNLKKAAFIFLRKNPQTKPEQIFFDLIAVSLDRQNSKYSLKHYKNIC